jgi:hypothetical protein
MPTRMLFAAALVVASLPALADPSCTAAPPPAGLSDYAARAAAMAERSRQGDNLSRFTVGWYVADLLAELAERDPELARRVRPDGRLVVEYLIGPFQDHAREEIQAVDALAAKANRPVRLAARYALEALRHIPDADDPAANQAEDRADLAGALGCVRGLLGG